MAAAAGALIAVIGTLLGSVVTHLFQRSAAERAQRADRMTQLRQEQIAAYTGFAGDVLEFMRAVQNQAYRHWEEPQGAEFRKARTETDRCRVLANHAMYRVQMLTTDADLVTLAEVAVCRAKELRRATDHEDLTERYHQANAALTDFSQRAANSLRTR